MKSDYIRENDSQFANEQEKLKLYRQQPRRKACKNCDAPLGPVTFIKLDVEYHACERCGHLNGAYQDTDEYCRHIYTLDEGDDYAWDYNALSINDYKQRIDAIYAPKAEFLKDSLAEAGVNSSTIHCLDIGAGAGYFVKAMLENGFTQTTGIEVSGSMVKMGKAIHPALPLQQVDLNDIYYRLKSTDAELISMIGVLEHLQQPRLALKHLRENPHIRYFYFSVPMFSMSLFLEMVSPGIMQRMTGFAHTHLYTNSSIDYLCNEFGFRRISEWWFGMDFLDLHRNISVRLMRETSTRAMADDWNQMIAPLLDELQLVLDRRKLSDEVHMLLDVSGLH